jgi:hypothetical protein
MWDHFCDFHLADWIAQCDRLAITITGKSAIQRAAQFCTSQDVNIPNHSHCNQSFSTKAFRDAIATWIVADDQVM